jgi:hypothetical protein
MSNVVYAVSTIWVSRTTQIVRGEPWASDDPIVVGHPEHFVADPDAAGVLRRSVPKSVARDTETATAAPGERRGRTNIRG